MREIKFRAWCENKEEWEKDYVLIVMHGQMFQMKGYKERQLVVVRNSTHILQQYTGLEDVNGKEIYEGDIVRFGFNGKLYEVYQHPSGDWRAGQNSLWEWIEGVENDWEVVGNIYEDRELLEA